MLALVATLASLAIAIGVLTNLGRHDGRKIVAALAGRSWAAEPPLTLRPITVRLSSRGQVPMRVQARPEWRAAA